MGNKTILKWEKSLLVTSKILRPFVNTLTANVKSFVLNRDNVTQPIQMQLSKNKKYFLTFFLHS